MLRLRSLERYDLEKRGAGGSVSSASSSVDVSDSCCANSLTENGPFCVDSGL